MTRGCIAIIPARGGSKRIPRKNIKPFAGKPMIAHAIQAALYTHQFDHVVVTTDDPEIAAISEATGAEVPFRRPAELADDHTPTVPVVAHAIEACRALGWTVDDVCCIYPAVPFIEAADIAEAFSLLTTLARQRFVFPVTGFPSPIQRALRRYANGGVQPFNPEHAATRTQDLEPAYFDAGQFYWGAAELWLKGLNIHANGASIVLPEWRVVDIDTPDDWHRAELLYKAIKGSLTP
ncbi:MAG TPA: pseudaminic acid cytidylyltransferase [Novosphingobium sp.]|nr:pseudaminic acid cytidylyltransferase [Novosphingobium sp.]HMP55287.1 pseudaminic acid cytidylyltransferase [Novosphingobium sp.]